MAGRLATGLLGRHVSRRAHHVPGNGALRCRGVGVAGGVSHTRETEVEQLDVSVVANDDVFRLHVAMRDARRVRRGATWAIGWLVVAGAVGSTA